MGDEFEGVLVSDFYGAYNDQGLHQRCWTHLLRDIHQLKEKYPEPDPQSASDCIRYLDLSNSGNIEG